MINETDLIEFYELLDRKQEEWKTTHEPLLEKQIYHLQELIRIQAKILGVKV